MSAARQVMVSALPGRMARILPSKMVMNRISRLLNFPITWNASKTTATVEVPGFAYDDFDRAGKICMWKLCRALELERMIHMNYPEFRSGKAGLVFVTQQFNVSPSLYRHWGILMPMLVTNKVILVGKTSFTSETQARNEHTGEVLVTLYRKLVSMDLATRRPRPLPENFVKQFGHQVSAEAPLTLAMEPFEKPTDTFPYDTKVTHTDLDFLLHLNNASYIKFCLNAAAEASESGVLPSFDGDIAFFHVKQMNLLYTGECHKGDELRVDTWECPSTPRLLKFIITNRTSPVFYGRIEYHAHSRFII